MSTGEVCSPRCVSGAVVPASGSRVTPEPREDHAAYAAPRLEVLREDKRPIVSAAAHAQRPVRGRKHHEEPQSRKNRLEVERYDDPVDESDLIESQSFVTIDNGLDGYSGISTNAAFQRRWRHYATTVGGRATGKPERESVRSGKNEIVPPENPRRHCCSHRGSGHLERRVTIGIRISCYLCPTFAVLLLSSVLPILSCWGSQNEYSRQIR